MNPSPKPELLRPITARDTAQVLEWNLRHVELLAPLDADRLAQLLDWSQGSWVITDSGTDVGFALTFSGESDYDSSNYRWFQRRHTPLLYLDRIVIDPAARRLGIASRVYDTIESIAGQAGAPLCLEVNLDPPNEPSLAFHRQRGFVEVGQQTAGGHLVTLMEKQVLTGQDPTPC